MPITDVKHSVEAPSIARAAQVVIWRNTSNSLGLPTLHFGHAALQLYENKKRRELISWWPGGEKGAAPWTPASKGSASRRLSIDATNEMLEETREKLVKKDFPPRPLQKRRKLTYSLVMDYHLNDPGSTFTDWMEHLMKKEQEQLRWMQLPDATVDIPGLSNVSRWGLHLPSIAAWWRGWVPDQTYKMLSTDKNCAGAVKLALKAGGSTWFKDIPNALIYSDPKSVEDYANDVKRIVRKLETDVATIERGGRRGRVIDPRIIRGMSQNVWTYQQWKSASYLGIFNVRSQLIKSIDAAVAAHEKMRAQKKPFETYGALVKIMMQIVQHRTQRPYSQRAPAVVQLAGQVLYNVDELIRGTLGNTWDSLTS